MDGTPLTLNRDVRVNDRAQGGEFVNRTRRRVHATLCGLGALGLLLTALNFHWPVARNALVYAKTSRDILAHHFNLFAVVRDQAWTGGKPILFPLLATPFTWIWNANTGVVVASFIGTVFFLWTSMLALTRLNSRSGVDPALMSLELSLIALNPLALYQFWSAYPDSLFAGFVLMAFYLTDVIATELKRDTRMHIAALGVVILAAIHTKLYGAVLCLICPVYFFLKAKQFTSQSVYLRSKIVGLCAALLAPSIVLILARFGTYPLISMNVNAGFNDYVVGIGGIGLEDIEAALAMMGIAILLAFHFLVPSALLAAARRMLSTPPAVFFLLYMGGLLPASGAAYNMRYFLPFFVLFAFLTAVGIQRVGRIPRRAILSCYGVIAVLLTANFNVAWVQEALYPFASTLFGRQLEPGAWFDNLRLRTQIALGAQIEAINEKVPSGSTLYWSSDYYGMAIHGLAHDLGVKSDLTVRYVLEPTDPPIASTAVFLAEFSPVEPTTELWRWPHWATVTELGHGVFRLDPVAVKLISLSGDSIPQGKPVKIREEVITGGQLHASTTEILRDGRLLNTTTNMRSELVLPDLSPGRHEFLGKARYGLDETAFSQPLVVYIGVMALERAATETADLIIEDRDGSIYSPRGILGLDRDERWIGLRFDDIALPQGARVRQAYLRFTVARSESEKTVVSIWGQRSANAAGLKFQNGDLSARPRTFSRVSWEPEPWMNQGGTATSADLTPVVDEIFSQKGWRPGNSVLLLLNVSGQSRLVAASRTSDEVPPTLYIEQESKE